MARHIDPAEGELTGIGDAVGVPGISDGRDA